MVTSQANDLPPCYGINVSPLGRLPSCLTNTEGSLVAGIPAEPRDLHVVQDLLSGDSTWRLFTHRGMETLGIHLLTTWTAVWDTQTRAKTHTDSNTHCFIIEPQLAIARVNSQSKNLAFCDGSTKEFSVSARSASSPGLSQKDCLRATDPEVAQLKWTE